MEACAVICRKATVALPDANFFSFYAALPSSRAQNRHFCALFASDPPVFGSFEHKIEVFVRFLPSEPPFSGVSSTKSRFLCAFAFRNPRFRAFRAQNRGFCALFAFGTTVIWPLRAQKWHFCALRDKHDSRRRSERQRHCRTREWHIIRLVFILSRIGK